MEHKNVQTSDGVSLHYIEAGSGHPLVMIPGWSQSAAEYRNQIEAFGQMRRVIALDMRGHGESEKTENGYRIQQLAKDLYDVIGALGIVKPDVLGHSMGASIMWSYLSMFGDDKPFEKLVIVDQAPACVVQAGWDDETKENAGGSIPNSDALSGFEAAVLNADTPDAIKEVIRSMFTETVNEDDLDWIAAENVKLPRGYAAPLLHDHCLIDWRSQIKAIRNPTLVIGAEGSIFTTQSQRWIAAQIPGAEVEIFEADDGGSHFMFFQNPKRFNAGVAAFLEG